MKQMIYYWCLGCEHGDKTDISTLRMCRGCLRALIYENINEVDKPKHYAKAVLKL